MKVSSFYDAEKSEPENGKYMFWYKVSNATQHNIAQYSTTQYNIAQLYTVQQITIKHNP